jgi:hypothetical protein
LFKSRKNKVSKGWLLGQLLFLVVFSISNLKATQAGNEFAGFELKTSQSEVLLRRQLVRDTLLPEFSGDDALRRLLQQHPHIWRFPALIEDSLGTALDVHMIYVDGVREEPFCRIRNTDHPEAWKHWQLDLGVDLISGSSSIAAIHIAQCLQQALDVLGYAVQRGGKTERILPERVQTQMREYRVNANLEPSLRLSMLAVHEEVASSGKCPANIQDYALLVDVYDYLQRVQVDMVQLQQDFTKDARVHSCSFSRRWNRRYEELVQIHCDPNLLECRLRESKSGRTRWRVSPLGREFEYVRKRFFGLAYGNASYRQGGTVMDMKLIPISSQLYLQAWVDAQGVPVTLGYVLVE